MAEKKGLGRGLNSLFESNGIQAALAGDTLKLRISEVEPDKNQPRKLFDDEKLSELTASIKKHGVISPIIVRKNEDGRYIIIAGERRWRASRRAGLTEIPAIVRNYDSRETMEISLIENLQREDLNLVEEAFGYKSLIDNYDLKQEEVAEIIGKSRPTITNALRLLTLPEEILEMLKNEEISGGHARALLSLDDRMQMITLADIIKKDELSVRAVEKHIKDIKNPKIKVKYDNFDEIHKKSLEKELSDGLSTTVKISKGKTRGKIELIFYNDDDLDRLITLLREC